MKVSKNNIALEMVKKEAVKRGIEEKIRVREFNGPVHAKVVLIDNELFITGSQNFHYSAFGDGGLTEYSIATDNKEILQQMRNEFETYWANGKLIEF